MRLRRGTYYYADARGGPKPWVKIGKTYAEAILRYAQLEAAKIQRRDFAALAAVYLERGMVDADSEPLAPTTQAVYKSQLKPLLKVFGRVLPADIEQQHAYQYMTESRGGKPGARQEVVLLSTILGFGVRSGWLKANPLAGIKLPSIRKRKRYISDAELADLVKRAEPEVAQAIRFLHYTALRVSDALRVRWRDWSADGLRVTISKTRKSGSGVIVFARTPGLEALMSDMRVRRVGSLSVLAERNGRPWTYRRFYDAWIALAREDSDTNIHDLRRKRLTDLKRERGLEFAQSVAAHTDPKTTRRYDVAEARVAL
jgi:integrase